MLATTTTQPALDRAISDNNTCAANECASLLLSLFEAGHRALLDELQIKGSSRALLHAQGLDQLYSIGGLVAALGCEFSEDEVMGALRFLSINTLIEFKKYNQRLWSIRYLAVSFEDYSRLKGGSK